ncbi:MAG TPA: condensation domain-containing protein [Methylobacterium sp.]|jgi:thioesterase domain-containing protein|uniref:condensation domain-containing protein n=1 Tax=Methylorubrum sp. B1-46 TaxID=2897334 RepID=UPI001E43131A|nr:condensation domain-containing protein [Methylorubrum sp. B1-46]UGB25806.1 condensation domain-containing protein [Methylorubrum sp. B1-46]HEV2544562.1 condensation domain-containing protein [Methylobacterium sp.]
MRHFTQETTAAPGETHGGDAFTARCSHSQTRFWLLDQLRPGDPSLHVAARWRIAGRLDAEILTRAFRILIERHEALRTSIVGEGGRPVQRIAGTVPLPFSEIDLSGLPGDRLGEARTIAESEAGKPFDLALAPLLRVTLLRLGRTDSLLLVTAHHSICDGWSMVVLAREFVAIYGALIRGQAPAPVSASLHYADFAEWEISSPIAAAAERDLAYWAQSLRDLTPFELPPDHPRRPGRDRRFAAETRLLPAELGARLEDYARAHGATPFVLACTILFGLLGARTGRSDIAIGTQVLGRDEVELEGVVGTFVNTLVLRTDLGTGQGFAERLAATRRTILDACDHALAPFDRVVQALAPCRDGLRPPLVSVNVRLRPTPIATRPAAASNEGAPSIRLVELDYAASGSFFDLDLELAPTEAGWRLVCEYDAGLYDAATVAALLADFERAACAAVGARLPDPVPFTGNAPEGGAASVPVDAAPVHPEALPETGVDTDDLRTMVRAIWREMLARPDLGDDDDFFASGGHSLLAARVVARIEAATGRSVPLWSFFEAGTVARLCALLSGAKAAGVRHRSLQEAPRAEERPGFTAIHHAAADPELYRPLAEALGADQPFATLQLESRLAPQEETLERLAGAYREAIETAQPRGPIRLVGFCRSGVLAFEIARQFADTGRDVALVVLIDCWEPGYFRRLDPRERGRAASAYRRGRLAALLRHLRRDGARYLVSRAHLRLRSNPVWRGLRRHLHRAGLASPNPEEAFWQVTDDLDALALAYEPRPHSGPVLIVRSESIPVGPPLDPMLGWRAFAENGETVSVPGFGHEGAFSEAGCRVMAAKISLMALR